MTPLILQVPLLFPWRALLTQAPKQKLLPLATEFGKPQIPPRNGQQYALSITSRDQAIKIIQSSKTLMKVKDGINARAVRLTSISATTKKIGSLSADYTCPSDVLDVGQTRKITRKRTHKHLPLVPAYHSPPILRQNNGVNERVPDFNQFKYPALPAPSQALGPHIPRHRQKRKPSDIQPVTTPSPPRTRSESPPPSLTTAANSNTSRTDRPRVSFWDSSSSKPSHSPSTSNEPQRKGNYWSTDQHNELQDSPGEQEEFWIGNDHSFEADADMREL